MQNQAELSSVVMQFLGKYDKVLEGRVWISGRIIETDSIRISALKPLFFNPALQTAENISPLHLKWLLEYLDAYRPVSPRGLIFYPSGNFHLDHSRNGISLVMYGDSNWAPGEIIDVIDFSLAGRDKLDEVSEILEQKKVSSFVFGKIVGRQDSDSYSILQRYYPE